MRVAEEKHCRVCRGELKVILDLGEIVPSGFTDTNIKEWEKAPLVLAECVDCKLVQLKHTVDLDLMYRQYWYSSALNKSMVSYLRDIVKYVQTNFPLKTKDVVLDIGCNDGTLLESYDSPEQLVKVGFDPALNLGRGDYHYAFINDYFTADRYDFPKAKVITAIAMFYDLPDPHQFVEDVATVLDKEGIFVVQFTDLLSMFKACAFDNICHEHLEYYKLADVKFLLEAHGLEVIDVSYNKVNGGSIRITAAHQGAYPVSINVDASYRHEKKYLDSYGINSFAKCIEYTKLNLADFFKVAKLLKKKTYLLGASTKGNTLLQVCNIIGEDVPYAAEVNSDKFGRYTAGTGIYIIPEDEALSLNPDFFLVPVWHFKDNLLKNPKIRQYIKDGGKLVFPLPAFKVIGKDDLKDD